MNGINVVALSTELACLLGEVVNQTKWIFVVTVVLKEGKSVPRATGTSIGAKLEVFGADEVFIKEVVEIAARTAKTIRGKDITVDIVCLDEFCTNSVGSVVKIHAEITVDVVCRLQAVG